MARIVDLTLPLRSGMPGVAFEPALTIEKDGWNATTLHLYSHAGTHMDAPIHYAVSEETVDAIPLERCMGPAWVADAADVGPRGLISPEHLGAVADRLAPGDGLLIRTGWSARHGTPEYRTALPRISRDLALWCVDHTVKILGVEQPAVADVTNLEELTAIHRILLGAGVVIVEGLAGLGALVKERVTFMAFPLRLAGGDGSPVRALAIEE